MCAPEDIAGVIAILACVKNDRRLRLSGVHGGRVISNGPLCI